LAELEERGVRLILGYRPSSLEEFWLALIHPPLVAFSDPSSPDFINIGVATSIPFEWKFDIFFSSNISKIPDFILNKETLHRKKTKEA
jgi:hypothetical protein